MRAAVWLFALAALFAVIIGLEFVHSGGPAVPQNVSGPVHTLVLDGVSVHVTLARTPAEQERGLGGRDSLAPASGMLFVFPRDGKYAFWMKDMRFSIDILWLADDGRVIYIVPNLSPASYPESFTPPAPARFVLEVPAGWTAAHNIHRGDSARLP